MICREMPVLVWAPRFPLSGKTGGGSMRLRKRLAWRPHDAKLPASVGRGWHHRHHAGLHGRRRSGRAWILGQGVLAVGSVGQKIFRFPSGSPLRPACRCGSRRVYPPHDASWPCCGSGACKCFTRSRRSLPRLTTTFRQSIDHNACMQTHAAVLAR